MQVSFSCSLAGNIRKPKMIKRSIYITYKRSGCTNMLMKLLAAEEKQVQ